MSLGETAKLQIPAALGYGARGAPGAIPPNSDLTFEVELLAIGTHKSPAFASSSSLSSSTSLLKAKPVSTVHREKTEEAETDFQDKEEERGNDTGCGRWKTNNNQWRCFVLFSSTRVLSLTHHHFFINLYSTVFRYKYYVWTTKLTLYIYIYYIYYYS